jgi:hypothetical protein
VTTNDVGTVGGTSPPPLAIHSLVTLMVGLVDELPPETVRVALWAPSVVQATAITLTSEVPPLARLPALGVAPIRLGLLEVI